MRILIFVRVRAVLWRFRMNICDESEVMIRCRYRNKIYIVARV